MALELNLLITFISGLLIGITPCILLMLSAFGGSLILIEEKGKFIRITVGLLSGFISSYLLITLLFLPWREIFNSLLFKIIFASILIILGIWQIIESKKEDSIIFGTPVKIKKVLKRFIEHNSAIYAFLVGIIFTLVKIPCFSSVYLAIISNVAQSPVLILYIIFYIIGVTIPIIVILILFRLGLEIERVNNFRKKYRHYLRALSGFILIFLSIYLLLYP
jgi:cytochrome c biogenesis protein CcdA